MTRPLFSQRWKVLTITAFTAFGLCACAADQPPEVATTNVASQENTIAETTSTTSTALPESPDTSAGEGDYVFGLERDNMVEVVEKTYESRGAKARWEGDVFVVAIEGDAQEDMAGFSDCRVLTQVLTDGDAVTIEYPNGTIICAEALADD